jgi:hypothetical protein
MSPLRAGTVAAYEGSLGEAIEAAFAAELFAQRGTTLPEVGKDDRRLLFASIAQGVLQYLSRHQSELLVPLPPVLGGGHSQVTLDVPTLSASGAGSVSGERWPTGTLTLTVLRTGAKTTATPSSGSLAANVGASSHDVVDARNGAGHAALAVMP